jgi:DNA-binding PucR family transcriptional regulator
MSLMGSIAEHDPDTARYVEDWLGILVEHDAATHSELVGTLFAFLGNDGDDDATARALGVDRSTVQRRIHRVRELTGFDLRDPDIVDDLHAATRIVTRHSLLNRPASAAVPEQRPASHEWPSQTY